MKKGCGCVWIIVALVLIALPLFTGGEVYQYHHVFPQAQFGDSEVGNVATIRTKLLDHYGQGGYTHNVFDSDGRWKGVVLHQDSEKTGTLPFSAYYKRKAALIAGRGTISYGLVAYNHAKRSKEMELFGQTKIIPPVGTVLWATKLDAVSSILYNVSYVCSIPAKFIHGTRLIINKEHYGLCDWFWLVGQLAAGSILAVVMLFVGTVIGLICHPLETFANLLFSLSALGNSWQAGPGSGCLGGTWFEFLGILSPFAWWRMGSDALSSCLLGSLWDLLWGSILAPLLDIFALF